METFLVVGEGVKVKTSLGYAGDSILTLKEENKRGISDGFSRCLNSVSEFDLENED